MINGSLVVAVVAAVAEAQVKMLCMARSMILKKMNHFS
jgi:hypothetical protein